MTGLKGNGRAELRQTDGCACFVYNRCIQLRPHLLQTIVESTPWVIQPTKNTDVPGTMRTMILVHSALNCKPFWVH